MKVTIVTATLALALASTPAFAQLAGSGNLISTAAKPPSGPSNPNHQSTTMVNGGVSTRGVLYGVNGGDAAPNVKTDNLIITPSQVRNATPDRSAGFWVETGAGKGSVTQNPTLRANVSNNLGAGPNSTFRSADVNVPNTGAGGGALGKNVTGGNLGKSLGAGNLGAGNLGNGLTGKLTGK